MQRYVQRIGELSGVGYERMRGMRCSSGGSKQPKLSVRIHGNADKELEHEYVQLGSVAGCVYAGADVFGRFL